MGALAAVTVEFPAVASADNRVALDIAVREEPSIVRAGVWQHDGGAVTQDSDRHWLAPVVGCQHASERAGVNGLGDGQAFGLGPHARRGRADVLAE